MAFLLADRVKDTSSTTGTGTLTLDNAPPTGFQAFGTAFANGDSTYYAILNGNGEWETGIGTYSANTLTRDVVLESSNSDALVSLSAGTKTVFVTQPAKTFQTVGQQVASALGLNGA